VSLSAVLRRFLRVVCDLLAAARHQIWSEYNALRHDCQEILAAKRQEL
jgi:hypothetical protein